MNVMEHAVVFPQRFRHLALLNPHLNDLLHGVRFRDYYHRFHGRYAPTHEEDTLVKATTALVDDYAEFVALNPDIENPHVTFFKVLRPVERFSGLVYHTSVDFGVKNYFTPKVLEYLEHKRGYHREGDLPKVPPATQLELHYAKSTIGFCLVVPHDKKYAEGERDVSARRVTVEQSSTNCAHAGINPDTQRHYLFETKEKSSYAGEGFILSRIHSPLYRHVDAPIETKVERTLQGLHFGTAWSGFHTNQISEDVISDVIPELEEQLILLDRHAIDNPCLRAKVHQFLGACYVTMETYDIARGHYEKVLELDPQPYRFSTAQAFLFIGEYQRAATLLKEVIAHNPVGEGLRALKLYLQVHDALATERIGRW